MKTRLPLALALVALAAFGGLPAARAATPCPGSYLVETAGERLAVDLGEGFLALGDCGAAPARIIARGGRVKARATFRRCAGLPGRLRVVATVTPPACDTMLLRVRAPKVALDVTLVGQATGVVTGTVELPEPAAGARAVLAAVAAAADADGDVVPGELIVRFREDASPAPRRFRAGDAEVEHARGNAHGRGGGLYKVHPRAGRDGRRATLDAAAALAGRPDVLWAQPNRLRHALRVPNDEGFAFQWHYATISLPAAWDTTIGSPDVVVAVVDTGLLIGHPDIAPERLVPGFDFISNPAIAQDGDGLDDDPFDVGDGAPGEPSTFHGTHVAGTIGAATDNGGGVAGVDWRARLMPVRALGRGGGTDFDIAEGIRFAAGLPNGSGRLPAERADVINLSLGGPGDSPAMREAIQDARAAGAIVVVAAGNDAVDAASFSPAAFPEVVCVSAVDRRGARAPYSNFGAVVDVAAPGGDTSVDTDGDGFVDGVLSTHGDDADGTGVFATFTFLQGTSMAAPHVSGVVALMQAAFMQAHGGVRMSPDQFDALLRAGALTDDLGADGFSGHGLVNAAAAVRAAAAGSVPPPADPPAPTDPPADPPADGEPGAPESALVVLLLDPDTDALVARADLAATGRTRFTLAPVGAGDYRLLAAIDTDGDGRIGETGEPFATQSVRVAAHATADTSLVLAPADGDAALPIPDPE